jgi:hypothetical protein
MSDSEKSYTLTAAEVTRFGELRGKLLHLHKALLDMERADHEKEFGRVNSGELLQLVINDAQFGWLRMISALVVEIDETLNAEEPATSDDFNDVMRQARRLFAANENESFTTRYQSALQREPAVVMAHSAVMQLLRADK